jgi:Flp pilus assembly protein TadD
VKFDRTLLSAILFGTFILLNGCSTKPSTTVPDTKTPTKTAKQSVTTAPKLKPVPAEAAAQYQKALLAIKNGQLGEAIALLEQISRKYPDLSGSHTNLGLIYLKRGEDDKANASLKTAVKINPKNAVAYTHLGIISRKHGKFRQAEKLYLQAIKADARYSIAHLNIGILYDLYLHDAEKALQHYNTYQGLLPDKDKTVHKWIVDLQRRIKAAGKS